MVLVVLVFILSFTAAAPPVDAHALAYTTIRRASANQSFTRKVGGRRCISNTECTFSYTDQDKCFMEQSSWESHEFSEGFCNGGSVWPGKGGTCEKKKSLGEACDGNDNNHCVTGLCSSNKCEVRESGCRSFADCTGLDKVENFARGALGEKGTDKGSDDTNLLYLLTKPMQGNKVRVAKTWLLPKKGSALEDTSVDETEDVSVEVDGGEWGTWTDWKMCPGGSHAKEFKHRVEAYDSSQGFDNTGVNSVAIKCSDLSETIIMAHPGFWGDWSEFKGCVETSAGFDSFEIQNDKDRDKGDDLAVTAVRFSCGQEKVEHGGLNWPGKEDAKWSSLGACPKGHLICGYQLRVEPKIDGDDTAMGNMRVRCCDKQIVGSANASAVIDVSLPTVDVQANFLPKVLAEPFPKFSVSVSVQMDFDINFVVDLPGESDVDVKRDLVNGTMIPVWKRILPMGKVKAVLELAYQKIARMEYSHTLKGAARMTLKCRKKIDKNLVFEVCPGCNSTEAPPAETFEKACTMTIESQVVLDAEIKAFLGMNLILLVNGVPTNMGIMAQIITKTQTVVTPTPVCSHARLALDLVYMVQVPGVSLSKVMKAACIAMNPDYVGPKCKDPEGFCEDMTQDFISNLQKAAGALSINPPLCISPMLGFCVNFLALDTEIKKASGCKASAAKIEPDDRKCRADFKLWDDDQTACGLSSAHSLSPCSMWTSVMATLTLFSVSIYLVV